MAREGEVAVTQRCDRRCRCLYPQGVPRMSVSGVLNIRNTNTSMNTDTLLSLSSDWLVPVIDPNP